MNRNLWLLSFLTAALIGAEGSAQNLKGQSAPSDPELRMAEGGTYSSKYFGFSLKLPENWTAYRRDASNTRKRQIEDAYAPGSPDVEAKIHDSIARTDMLLTLSKFPFGSNVAFNPIFAVAAEPLVKDIKTGEDALRHIRAGRLYLKYRTEVTEDIHMEGIGGADFAVMTEKISVGDLTVRQKYYVTISKGYALGFVLAYTEEKDLRAMLEVINSLNFDRP